ncbi:hypothetical protein [Streptosporangium canum]|uniref:hypothetical protein n=1 Tax=Streptosporangium canum TaxID=324952 RepID=UPI000B81A3AD|nr:hypothetical protein [Streptosporangium canum]
MLTTALTSAYWADERAGHVGLGVWVATPELRHQVDAKYGRGLVVLEGFLAPSVLLLAVFVPLATRLYKKVVSR